jgi:predicted nucleic acid-binding protein
VILADTSIWIDHLRSSEEKLAKLLTAGAVLAHPFVIGEIALGGLRQRDRVLEELHRLPAARIATDAEVLRFIEAHALFGRGIGYVDAHLLAAVRLSAGATLWTRDKRLRDAARALALAANEL